MKMADKLKKLLLIYSKLYNHFHILKFKLQTVKDAITCLSLLLFPVQL